MDADGQVLGHAEREAGRERPLTQQSADGAVRADRTHGRRQTMRGMRGVLQEGRAVRVGLGGEAWGALTAAVKAT